MPYALKGQKLLAQGSTLGFRINSAKSPWKGKSFEIESFCPFRATLFFANITQGAALGKELLPFQGVLNQWTPAKDLHRFWAWIESENVKKYKQGVAFPHEWDTQNQKIIPKKTNITPHFQIKTLSLHQDFYNLYHEGFKIL